MRVDGKTVVITGAGSGIGAVTARRFDSLDAEVVVTDVDGESADAVADDVGARSFQLDVRDRDRFVDVCSAVEDAIGPIDVLVNNAGVSPMRRFLDSDRSEVQQALDVNLFGTWNGCKAVVPSMRANGGGAIVNVASVAALRGWFGQSAYGLSKAAVVNLTLSVAKEEAQNGIRVNAVCPGTTDTQRIRDFFEEGVLEMFEDLDDGERARKRSESQYPIGRFVEPEEVAASIVFLASDDATGIVGETLTVDGGYTVG